jgi:glycosyltransferase involved in cell wall biosynthesis
VDSDSVKRWRVGIDCRYFNAKPSGIGETVAALVKYLPDLAPEIDFLFFRHPECREPLSSARNVREITVSSPANGPATLLRLPGTVDLTGLDLFHAPANIHPGGLTIPCVTTIHDIMWLTHPKWCNPAWWGKVEQRFYGHGMRRALSRSAAIATVSEATRQEILQRWPQLVHRVSVTRSGVSRQFAPVPRDPALLAEAGINPAHKFCLVVGQYAPYKNHETAIAAFAAAFGNCPALDLVLVQRRGPRASRLQKQAEELGVGGRVLFLPATRREVLIQLYSAAELLLHPSLCEGFGNPVAEAMACGCPVITSNLSAMPEVSGGAAILADPRDIAGLAAALRQVVSDSSMRQTLRQRGLARARELDWKEFAAANLAIYRRVLSAGQRSVVMQENLSDNSMAIQH